MDGKRSVGAGVAWSGAGTLGSPVVAFLHSARTAPQIIGVQRATTKVPLLHDGISTQHQIDSHLLQGSQLLFGQCIEVDGRMLDRAGTIPQYVPAAKSLGSVGKMTDELPGAFQDTMRLGLPCDI